MCDVPIYHFKFRKIGLPLTWGATQDKGRPLSHPPEAAVSNLQQVPAWSSCCFPLWEGGLSDFLDAL